MSKHASPLVLSLSKDSSVILITFLFLATSSLYPFPRFGYFNRKNPSRTIAYHELKGIALTQDEMRAVRNAQKGIATPKDEHVLEGLDKRTGKLAIIQDQLFWHHHIPTIGLAQQEPLHYPFIPHMFNLWQLAPHKGKGVTVTIIDTGIAEPWAAACAQHEQLNMMQTKVEDPIQQCIDTIRSFLHDEPFDDTLPHKVVDWIYNYICSGDVSGIVDYAQQQGVQEIDALLQALTTGPRGIIPAEQYQASSRAPVVRSSDDVTTYIAGHGTHTYGLIGSTHGLAPKASVIMIKAFNDDGTSNKATLIAALKRAYMLKSDIVNLGLKIADSLDTQAPLSQLLEKMIGAIPYVVAASGNSAQLEQGQITPTVAYPARFNSVSFDVGAFNFYNKTCSIGPFSQYEKGIGPKFVAPGTNIVSYGLIPKQTEDVMYLFMDGTSPATALMTGFVTLMVSEFKHDFTKDELLKVCSKAVVRMHNNDDWHNKVLYGVLDMRTALFVLHVLRAARQEEVLKGRSFDALLEGVCDVIFAHPREYAAKKLRSVDFTQDFMKYVAKARKKRKKFKMERYIEGMRSDVGVEDAVGFVTKALTEKSPKVNGA